MEKLSLLGVVACYFLKRKLPLHDDFVVSPDQDFAQVVSLVYGDQYGLFFVVQYVEGWSRCYLEPNVG